MTIPVQTNSFPTKLIGCILQNNDLHDLKGW